MPDEEFERPIDKILREAREKGAFDDLPGKGKPIQWEDESMVPEDQRMAQRLLKHNGFTLDWIALGKEIEGDYEILRRGLELARSAHRAGGLDDAEWQSARERFRDGLRALNKRIIGYNLRVPHERLYKRPYPIEPDEGNSA
jgi:hypothetical protein